MSNRFRNYLIQRKYVHRKTSILLNRHRRKKFYALTFCRTKNKPLMWGLITVTMIFLMYIYIITCIVNPILLQLVEANAIYKLNIIVDTTVKQYSMQNDLSSENLYDITYDKNGQVASSTVNLAKISRLKSSVSKSLQEEFSKITNSEIVIPLGRVTGIDYLFDWGPKIKIKLISAGIVSTDFKSIFHNVGINQTKHEIQLLISSHFAVLLPNFKKIIELKTLVPIAESLIIGPVPNVMTDLNKFITAD